MPFILPISAKISPTSPRGIILIPISILFVEHFCVIKKAPIYLPKTAIKRKTNPIYQNSKELKSSTFMFIERPTITKKIGVKSCMIGVIEDLTFFKKSAFSLSPNPKGKKNLRESAIPAANAPSISGAPLK